VQSFMLTEVRDCDLLIVVTSSTFLKRKDMLKEKKKAVSPDHQNPRHSIGNAVHPEMQSHGTN